MEDTNNNLSLNEAASRFLATLAPKERGVYQSAVNKFIRWFGLEQLISGVTAAGIDDYVERQSLSDADYMKKLGMIRDFLNYIKKEGWSQINLAVHLKARKGKVKQSPVLRQNNTSEPVFLSRHGLSDLEAELASLKNKRLQAIDEIRKAAADKDFRENVPLQAAREARGHIEGRIKELEAMMKVAVLIEEKQNTTLSVSVGDCVVLLDQNQVECRYTIVGPREADPAKGKISGASPIGKALIGKVEGEITEVNAPVGKLRYQIKKIEH